MSVTNLGCKHVNRQTPSIRPILLFACVCLLTSSPVQSQDFDTLGENFDTDLDTSIEPALPEVLTTTRLRQPKSRVPGTTTVITGDLIRQLGIMNLEEIFRLVPGMTVNYVGSNIPVTSYHGTVHYEQRRLQVQIDGRTAYRPNLSDMDWNTIPVPIELIERVEVSRGPNSAAYGINAFLGTINIITRSPADTAGAKVKVVSGSRGYRRAAGSVGYATDQSSWRLSFQRKKSDGFDAQGELDNQGNEEPFRDELDINIINYDSLYTLSDHFDLDIRAGVVDGTKQQDPFKEAQFSRDDGQEIDIRDYYLQSKLNYQLSGNHDLHFQVSFQNYDRRERWLAYIPGPTIGALIAANGVDPSPAAGADFVGMLNEDIEESRLEFELQDRVSFNPDLKLVTGIGYREDTYRSETLFNGRGANYQSRVFGNLEYTPVNWLTINSGANWEKTTTTDDHYFSPRVAANLQPLENHVLRFVFSRAVRTPDAYEQDPDVGFVARNVNAPYAFFEGGRIVVANIINPATSTLGTELEEERITSREISYFGQFYTDPATISLEIRYFNDDLRDMISGILSAQQWTIDNNVALEQEGFEVEAEIRYPLTTVRLGYAYLDQEGRYTGTDGRDADDQQYAIDLLGRLSVRHSGSLAVIQELPFDLTASGAYYWADEFRLDQFERLDLRLAKAFYGRSESYEVALTMQHYLQPEPDLSDDNIIRDHNQFFIEGSVRF